MELSLRLSPPHYYIDDMGIKQLAKRSGEYLFEIILRRYETRSTIMTSNRPLEDWGKLPGRRSSSTQGSPPRVQFLPPYNEGPKRRVGKGISPWRTPFRKDRSINIFTHLSIIGIAVSLPWTSPKVRKNHFHRPMTPPNRRSAPLTWCNPASLHNSSCCR